MHVAFTAEQNNTFIYNYDSVKFTAVSSANATLEHKLDVISYGNAVKSAGKINRINRNVSSDYLGTANSDYRGMIYNVLTILGEPYSLILITVLISAGIENTLCIDADGLSLGKGAAAQAFIF